MKVLLILVDGMRPDSLTNIPLAQQLLQETTHTMNARTVMPSVTLPCHMSLFHSVDPARHGTTTNVYAPQVRPVEGLCEVLAQSKKKCAFFYDWEQLRDLTRPGSLYFSYFQSGRRLGWKEADRRVTDTAIEYLTNNPIDFAFLYQGNPDETGHAYGWMGKEYMEAVAGSWENIRRVLEALSDDYTVIITADHGGHDRMHGTELPEDMITPLFLLGKPFAPGKQLPHADIRDIAPTVAALLGVEPDEDWEGRSLL